MLGCSSHIPSGSSLQPASHTVPGTIKSIAHVASLCFAGVTEDRQLHTRIMSQHTGINSPRMIPANREQKAQPVLSETIMRQVLHSSLEGPECTEDSTVTGLLLPPLILFTLPRLTRPSISISCNHFQRKSPAPKSCLKIFFSNHLTVLI